MTAAAPPRALTDEMLATVTGTRRAVISATEPGVVAGLAELRSLTASGKLGHFDILCADGDLASAGSSIAEIAGTAAQLAAAENAVLGPLGFAGGIARRCRDIVADCPEGLRVVCGGWKKLPAALKPALRAGLSAGGVGPRLVDGDFVYVDKNVVTLLGGIAPATGAALRLAHGPVAVQVTSPDEAAEAVDAGACIVMDDTGEPDTLSQIDRMLRERGVRDQVTLAFGGGVRPNALADVRRCGADVVDLGRAILDAPLWDVHLVVTR